MGNMYLDSVQQWNVFVGCEFDCIYCRKSFQAQMKRQKPMIDKNGKKRGCQLCYEYKPHFHKDRLNQPLRKTKGDEFIWVGSSGDISFIEHKNMLQILNKIEEHPDRTFFFQTKNPSFYKFYDFPKNVILGITLETNIWKLTCLQSNAPDPESRYKEFLRIKHPRKCITIEPIMDFDLEKMVNWCVEINPERVYIGYDTKKNNLPEPILGKTWMLIDELEKFTKVKKKLLRKAWDENEFGKKINRR